MSTATMPDTKKNLNGDSGASDVMVQEVFNQTFLFLALKTRKPSFVVKIPRRDVAAKDSREIEIRVDGKVVSDDAAKATRTDLDLLPKEERIRLNAAYGRVSAYFRTTGMTYSHPTLDQLRLLPAKMQEQFFGGWPAVQDRFSIDLEGFFQNYTDVVVPHGRSRIIEYFAPEDAQKAMDRHLPPLARARSRFGVSIVQGTFSHDDPADAASAVRELSEGIRGKLEEALEAVSSQLVHGKKLSEKTFTDLKTAIATAKAFGDVVGMSVVDQAETLEKRLDSLSERIDLRPKTMSITDVVKGHRNLLNDAIDGLVTSIKDPDVTAQVLRRFGVKPRYIGN